MPGTAQSTNSSSKAAMVQKYTDSNQWRKAGFRSGFWKISFGEPQELPMCIEGKTIFSLQQDDRSVCQCLFKTLVLALESHANPHQPELLAFNCLLPLKQNRAGQDSAFKKDNASPRFCLTPSRLKEVPLVPALYDKHRNGTVPHLQQHWWFIVSLGEYQCCEATRTKC